MTTKVSLIADSSVTGAAINNLTITSDDIANNAVTTDKINFGTALVPLGGIIMWSGITAPSGYQLCNGSDLPSTSPLRPGITNTPDLRDRFIVGAGSAYTPGNTGGANSVTLDSTQMPYHNHTASDSGHSHPLYNQIGGAGNSVGGGGSNTSDQSSGTGYASITVGYAGGSNGVTHAHENRPPYYALAFIMRVL